MRKNKSHKIFKVMVYETVSPDRDNHFPRGLKTNISEDRALSCKRI